MQQDSAASLAVGIVGLALVTLTTLPVVRRLARRFSKSHSLDYFPLTDKYEDNDGEASEESASAYSAQLQRILLGLIGAVGTIFSFITAVSATSSSKVRLPIEQWLTFVTWILLLVHVVTTIVEPSFTARFRLTVSGALSCLFLAAAIVLENLSFWSRSVIPEPQNVHLTLTAVSFGAAVLLLCVFVSIPRRPDVFKEGKLVDRQYTVSLIARLCFVWVSPLLATAKKNKSLEQEDLPKIDYQTRSKTLRARFENVQGTTKLWKRILRANWYGLSIQLILCIIVSVANFAPQAALLAVLRILEKRDLGFDVAFEAWTWVIALGLAMALSGWVEAWLFWTSFSKVGIPIYEQISATIFGKSMRRKDVKSTSKKKEPATETNGDLLVNKGSGGKGEDSVPKEGEEEEEEEAKTRQSTINLIAVDGKRISDFSIFSHIFPGSAIKLIVALGFLVSLIGWIPLLCGLLVPILATPVNIFASTRYAKAQDDLMKVRDQKMALVTEALQGIRQIKFSALESEWHQRVMDMRMKELRTQWRVFKFDTTLISIWILSPVLLSAVSLALYTIIHRELSASVAFTTLSVFEAIEMTLSVIPELTTDFLDAKVSAERIEKYLNSPEIEDKISPGSSVTFNDATIAWPTDEPDNDEVQFQLRGLNLSFPKRELSVVSGKTGSGKSLLLASIIGESDILEGRITAPKPPPQLERYDEQATKNDWIIEGALAYVAQIPWIENASIKANILFGLPCDDQRYKKVLHACALEKDLEMLPDGELTDIGANGINLSGGQKWRVSFARALYSRAGILILDDIFSAVDAHVGRHLFEEALTGELGKGRTRILVTHHVALCLPRTKYSVLLADGTAQHAGTVEDLQRTGHIKALLAQDIEVLDESSDDTAVEDENEEADGTLERVATNRSSRSRRKSVVIDPESEAKAANKSAAPKKFTEDEKKERGAVKYTIYKAYIRASGGAWYWMFIWLVFTANIIIYLARSAREAKRLESNAKSPVFEQFGSALTGIGTIRAFDKSETYVERQYTKIDRHAQCYWHLWLFNRWLGFRLNLFGAVFATVTAALIVGIQGIDASLAGFALSFALQYTEALTWALRQYANVELDMNATERIVEFSNVGIESQGGHDAPAAWPTEGKLEVQDLVVGYAADLPPVLKGISFDVAKNQRVGVVGRTGAGKSSLTMALFRFLEAREGSVHIDGLNIADLKLHDLRRRLAIIPQDPVLFSGTVRSNLDPFDQHAESELLDALERVHLISSNTTTPVTPTKPSTSTPNTDLTGASGSVTPVNTSNPTIRLSTKISEGGLNLSQGQRQLLCLARAIVSRPKIMVLDEATSAVDMETDALIQRSIREEFGDATLIVIAHRLSTIADFDKILVLGEGKVREYDEPLKLMEVEGGEFKGMVEESGEKEELVRMIKGEGPSEGKGDESSDQKGEQGQDGREGENR
ncbi:MAG: hypothetical protein Q9227_007249 [Pyrenula ochraceoflavens]